MEIESNINAKLRKVSKRHIVAWFGSDGRAHLTTWSGKTEHYIMGISPDDYVGDVWNHSPDVDYFEFTEKLSTEEQLRIAREINGTLVIAFAH